jgi:hypothetical protein
MSPCAIALGSCTSGWARAHKGRRIHLYVDDLDVRIVSFEGELLRHLEIDPSRSYQGRNREVE